MHTAILFCSLVLAKVFASLFHKHKGELTQSLEKLPLLSRRNSVQEPGEAIGPYNFNSPYGEVSGPYNFTSPDGIIIPLYNATFDIDIGNGCETWWGVWQIMETPDTFLVSCNESFQSFSPTMVQQTICATNSPSSIPYFGSQCNDIYMELYQAYVRFEVPGPPAVTALLDGCAAPNQSALASSNITCNFVPLSLSDFSSPETSCGGDEPLGDDLMDWQDLGVDANLQIFLAGGIDNQGIPWTGLQNGTLSAAIGVQMLNEEGYSCSLEDPCTSHIACETIGSYSFLRFGQPVLNLAWVYPVIEAFQNINQQLSNQYKAIDVSAIDSALATFNIYDFYSQPNPPSGLLDAFIGLGTIFSIVGGFVPVFGPGLSAVGAILPAVSSFLGNSITAAADPNIAQKSFAPLVEQVINDLVGALDSAASKLFDGDSINGITIIDMMKGGYWVDNTSLEPLSDITNQMTIEILSRSIDSLWKTPTHNKMWVLFTDLGDGNNSTANCNKDNSGPPDSKYCADGGVYYTYNFIENGHLSGYLGYPWGATKLSDFNITISWITEASAKTYRLAKRNALDPFNFNQTVLSTTFLNESVLSDGQSNDLQNYAGRYPGSWTLPVCDASTWGQQWNFDYVNHDATVNSEDCPKEQFHETRQHPPCICGASGLETAPWAHAAGLQNFQTFYNRCRVMLTDKSFVWPEGVTNVSYGFNSIIQKPSNPHSPGEQDDCSAY